MSNRYVIESPLAGDFVRNFRFLLWCCRAVWKEARAYAIGSHMICPWYMDDTTEHERQFGINNDWVWGRDVPHLFFTDLDFSGDMRKAEARCKREGIPQQELQLVDYSLECWKAFERGDWPPHTPGFEIKPKLLPGPDPIAYWDVSREQVSAAVAETVAAGPALIEGACQHPNVTVLFDYEASKGLSAEEVRKRWPRFHGRCPDCEYYGVIYASREHMYSGDW